MNYTGTSLTTPILGLQRRKAWPGEEQATPYRPLVLQQRRLSTKPPNPSIYYGDKNKLEPFIAQLRLKITVNSDHYPTEPAAERIAYAVSRDALAQVAPYISKSCFVMVSCPLNTDYRQ